MVEELLAFEYVCPCKAYERILKTLRFFNEPPLVNNAGVQHQSTPVLCVSTGLYPAGSVTWSWSSGPGWQRGSH